MSNALDGALRRDPNVHAPGEKQCTLCGRIGTRGFVSWGIANVCTAKLSCDRRRARLFYTPRKRKGRR